MFGDIGHGLVLFAFAAFLCWKKDMIMRASEDLYFILKIRYLLLMMGFFATFCGFIYNDMMSLPLNLFGSCYTNDPKHPGEVILEEDCVYPFGVDPKWYVSSKELTFMNSLKMKLAVLYGVSQMTLGVCMKGFNNIYYKQGIDFVFEFIPQLIFLVALFGFMDLMIVMKWLTDYTGKEHLAPSVISQMINMFLNGG
jgi:V-type H+-transporting ATPase subunit a